MDEETWKAAARKIMFAQVMQSRRSYLARALELFLLFVFREELLPGALSNPTMNVFAVPGPIS